MSPNANVPLLNVPENEPSTEWWASVQQAYQDICRLLTHNINGSESPKSIPRIGTPKISIVPAGNFACQLSRADEELECVAFGTVRTELFEEATWQNLVEWQESGNHATITPYSSSGGNLVLGISNFTFNVKYVVCPALLRS